jgi:hypothetical protein
LTVLAQPAPASKIEVPIISQDAAIQRDLLSLDQHLETNPKLEETLRNNLDQIIQESMQERFRAQNPDVDALLKRQPTLVQALKAERHFFIHRYIARLARAKVTRKDAVALDEFLSGHPDIAKALARRPGQIVESDFLIAHPQLAQFFETHPALSSVILERNDKKPSGKADAKK